MTGAQIITGRPSVDEMVALLAIHKSFIKVAVDIRKRRIAAGGEWHADCEALLLETGSEQVDIWGGDWIPSTREVEFISLINLAPTRNNSNMEILNPDVRIAFEEIVREYFDAP